MTDLLKYPPRVLMAFGETFFGKKEFIDWLLGNGYPELAALSFAIQGSEDAFDWLMENGFPQLAALDSAIDEDANAYHWLRANKYVFSAAFSDACHGRPDVIDWFNRHNMQAVLRICRRIRELRESKTFDYHKLHF